MLCVVGASDADAAVVEVTAVALASLLKLRLEAVFDVKSIEANTDGVGRRLVVDETVENSVREAGSSVDVVAERNDAENEFADDVANENDIEEAAVGDDGISEKTIVEEDEAAVAICDDESREKIVIDAECSNVDDVDNDEVVDGTKFVESCEEDDRNPVDPVGEVDDVRSSLSGGFAAGELGCDEAIMEDLVCSNNVAVAETC